MALRAARLYELERVSHFSTVERLIYEHAVRGNVDDDEARKSTPALWSYVAAWACVVASVAASALYLLSFGSSLGVRASRLWLLELLYTFLLIYGVIETLYIMGFDVLLPGLLKEHYEKFHDPTSLREYPFATPLPTISTFYLALWHGDELGGTQVGAHCLGTAAPAKKTAADLNGILEDASWRPSLPFRVPIYLASFFIVLPSEVQQALFEECVLFFWACVATAVGYVPLLVGEGDGSPELRLLAVFAAVVAAAVLLRMLFNAGLALATRLLEGETRADFAAREKVLEDAPSMVSNPMSNRRAKADIELTDLEASGPDRDMAGPAERAERQKSALQASRTSVDAVALRLGQRRHKVRNSTFARKI